MDGSVVILAQEAEPHLGFGWATIAALVVTIITINWKRLRGEEKKDEVHPVRAIVSVVLATMIVGSLATMASVKEVNSFAGWIADWLSAGESSSWVPFICLAISLGVRISQVFQGASETIKMVLGWIPDILEWAVIALAALVGGIAMAGSDDWRALIFAWSNMIGDTFVSFVTGLADVAVALFGLFT